MCPKEATILPFLGQELMINPGAYLNIWDIASETLAEILPKRRLWNAWDCVGEESIGAVNQVRPIKTLFKLLLSNIFIGFIYTYILVILP